MNWTKEQKEAIEIRDKNILVSAAAGSGKTAVLVERIKRLIGEEKVPLEEMLVVTFTNAAASEMREKIVSALPDQMAQIHKAHISTFHAFALDVIRCYFHLINLEPGFKICDETQRVLLQTQAMDQLFHTKFLKEDQDFLHFLKLYATGKSDEPVKDMIQETHSFIQSLPDPFFWLNERVKDLKKNEEEFKAGPVFREILGNIEEELASAIAGCKRVINLLEDAEVKSLLSKAKADLDMIHYIKTSFLQDFDEGQRAVQEAKFQVFTAAKIDRENYETVREDIKLLRDGVKENIKNLALRYCIKPLDEYLKELNDIHKEAKILFRLVQEFDELYRQQKEKFGIIDFSDIEHYALEILSNQEAAHEYQNKFRYIFIDEYQDSNLVQECLIEKIRRKNNVFMVGDVKQSIYKFRLAEPEIFIKKYNTYKEGIHPFDLKIDLNRNFRSKGNIISIVNEVFGQIMSTRTAGMDYDKDATLYKGVDYNGPLDHPVELHLVDDQQMETWNVDEEIKEMKKAELEAFTAASLIKEFRGLPYYDAKTGEERILRNKDIVILLRSIAGIGEIYYEALEREGIPAYMDMGDGLFDTLEVSVFLNLLKVIDNRKQDVSLLSVLRSPIFGFSISGLAEIRIESKSGDYFSAFLKYSNQGKNDPLRERCSRALAQLKKWKERSGFLPLDDFLWELLLETGYYNYVGALPGGGQRQGNLRALVDKAALYEGSRAKGLFGFINYVEAMKKGKVAIAPFKLLGESDDVVRIMTVHKSKGLEFPMVLAGNLGRRFHPKNSNQVSLHKELGLALKLVDREQGCWKRTLLQDAIDERKAREDLAEEIRILYVSLTRSMDKLVLLGSVSDGEKTLKQAAMQKSLGIIKGKSFMDFLLPTLIESDQIILRLHHREGMSLIKEERKENKSQLLKAMVSGFEIEDSELASEIENRLGWKYSFAKALDTKSKYSVSELSRGDQITSFTGINRGLIYHKVMEHMPFDAPSYEIDRIRTYVMEMVEREIISPKEIQEINLSKVAQFFNSPIGKRARKAEEVFREVSFNLMKERDGEEIIVQGTIDCYFREGDRVVLLDYKSNYVIDEIESITSLVERYRPQMELYKEALEEIREVQVGEMYLFLFAIGKEIKL
ncbi:MAG: helicase-exonuclease AddAB subunit AddA [Eubacteriales bacterium]|nr:helicase-exonuclease AddAB subunit AddA [Eubacteriales bacterium]